MATALDLEGGILGDYGKSHIGTKRITYPRICVNVKDIESLLTFLFRPFDFPKTNYLLIASRRPRRSLLRGTAFSFLRNAWQTTTSKKKSGSSVRYVLVGNIFVNYELVRQGYAMAGTWEPDVACDEVFREAENKAREEKSVIWVDKEPTDEPVRGPGGDVAFSGNVVIVDIFYNGVVSDKEPDEFVEIRNDDIRDIQLNDWSLYDEADHRFKFPEYVIAPGETCRIYTNEIHPESCGFSFYFDKTAIWNNGGDCATLINANGDLVAQKCY